MIHYFGHFEVKLCRSYTALADVLSLFVVLPLMVRTLGFHDMTIVICAVSAHVRLVLDLINSMLVVVVMVVTDMGPVIVKPLGFHDTTIAFLFSIGHQTNVGRQHQKNDTYCYKYFWLPSWLFFRQQSL